VTLYDPAAFEPLTEEPWDEERVRAGVRGIVADVDGAFDPADLWPAHEWDGWQAALPMKNLYVGAAGVVWALDELRRRGHAETTLDLSAAAQRTLELWRADPDWMEGEVRPEPPQSALLAGESGILLTAHRLRLDVAGELEARIRANVANETEELFWGTPGTLLAAVHAGLDHAARESADALAARRADDGLWTQRLWGKEFRSIGASHGATANVRALLHVDDPRNETLRRETASLLAERATVEDGLANWEDGRVQWCVGAPGIVIAAWDYLDEELLLAAAELVWRAGAHGDKKGAGICHGTAGNGYALLKTFARTGDERWLERARAFAVHALAQAERLRSERGQGRYSLFTGDPGTALFAAACVDADVRYPLLDV
jgi:hypothetical protein